MPSSKAQTTDGFVHLPFEAIERAVNIVVHGRMKNENLFYKLKIFLEIVLNIIVLIQNLF